MGLSTDSTVVPPKIPKPLTAVPTTRPSVPPKVVETPLPVLRAVPVIVKLVPSTIVAMVVPGTILGLPKMGMPTVSDEVFP